MALRMPIFRHEKILLALKVLMKSLPDGRGWEGSYLSGKKIAAGCCFSYVADNALGPQVEASPGMMPRCFSAE